MRAGLDKMCGILGIAGSTTTSDRLVQGLRRLEYRGYDSAGVAVLAESGLQRRRAGGKIANLEAVLREDPCDGPLGIAHTRWATHGKPGERNAHPHVRSTVAIVHNGIIENFRELREELEAKGHIFASETDSEVIAHVIASYREAGHSMRDAFHSAIKRLRGAYAVAAICRDDPDRLYGARRGSPLVVGLADGENYLGSDAIALADWTRRVIYLDEDDWCELTPRSVAVFDFDGQQVERPEQVSNATPGFADKGEFRHFMDKEIHEQPEAVSRTLSNYIDAVNRRFSCEMGAFWDTSGRLIGSACGTAYYAAATAKYWFERYARIPVEIDIASEFRYRSPVMSPGDRAIFVSQSGETADTLAALRFCRDKADSILSVVNVPNSSIARESDLALPIHAGIEIGVASTKAFTCQLNVLLLLALKAAEARGRMTADQRDEVLTGLRALPGTINAALDRDEVIAGVARKLAEARDILFLGRGLMYPLALEGALKLKEISYIHAEAYASGELKHGPIALIDKHVPVVVMAPKDALFEKTVSNMQEVMARGGKVCLITDAEGAAVAGQDVWRVIQMPSVPDVLSPILYALPAQLLAYHTAIAKGTDVDQPRNLAKSVTVE